MEADGAGEAECGVRATGVDAGLGVATADVDADAAGAPFFIAAIFAAISALFWAMRSAAACKARREHAAQLRRAVKCTY